MRTCGGLGNQLFQAHYARLMVQKHGPTKVYHYHSMDYPRPASWELGDLQWTKAPRLVRFLLRLRIPQILYRLKISPYEYLRFAPILILDGYFLDPKEYSGFSMDQKNAAKWWIRGHLGIRVTGNQKALVHLRLGDFFKDADQKRYYLDQVFKAHTVQQADVITNEESLVANQIDSLEHKDSFTLCPTSQCNGIELLAKMAEYSNIVYNGSTLAFWAAVLSGAGISWYRLLEDHHYVTQNCILLQGLAPHFEVIVNQVVTE